MTTPNRELTSRQKEALSVYEKLTRKNNGLAPTVRQFAEALGCSANAAQYQLNQLREKGYLTMPKITHTRLTAKAKRAL